MKNKKDKKCKHTWIYVGQDRRDTNRNGNGAVLNMYLFVCPECSAMKRVVVRVEYHDFL